MWLVVFEFLGVVVSDVEFSIKEVLKVFFLMNKLLLVKFSIKVLVSIGFFVVDIIFLDVFEEWFNKFLEMVGLIEEDEVIFFLLICYNFC